MADPAHIEAIQAAKAEQALADRAKARPDGFVTYVVEYDENSVAWLVHVTTGMRLPVEHGMLLVIAEELRPSGRLCPAPDGDACRNVRVSCGPLRLAYARFHAISMTWSVCAGTVV